MKIKVIVTTEVFDERGNLIDTTTKTETRNGNNRLSVAEAAKIIGVSRTIMWGYCNDEKIPCERIGGHIFVREDVARNFVRPRRGRPVKPAAISA